MCGLAATLLGSYNAVAEESPRGHLVRVPLPIVGSVDDTVRRSIRRLLADGSGQADRPLLVLEFWPTTENESSEADGSEFERSLSLARFLSSPELSSLRTVAYLPRTVLGHAVLPVLACEEIVMHPDAEFGAAGIREERPSAMMRGFYEDVANRTRAVPAAVALGMLDRNLKVVRATTPTGVRYVLSEEVERLKKETTIQEVETVADEGDFVRLSGRDMRLKYGFASRLAANHRELANELSLATGDLEPNPSLGGEWQAIQVQLAGPINKSNIDRTLRAIEAKRRLGSVNLICLILDSPGGSPADSVELANYLSLLDSSQIRTVAYVANQALGDAAVIALACDHLVMERAAILGGPGTYQPNADDIGDLKVALQRICADKSRSWSLPLGLLDADLVVNRYRVEGTDVVDYFCEEEWQAQADPDQWVRGELVKERGRPLQTVGTMAAELDLAKYVVEDFADFKVAYSLTEDPEIVEPTWADDVIDYLARPHVAGTLLFFAGFALMIELSSPGVGAGAFVSSVCFVVFFWSQFLHGTANWLEILLFITGLVFLGLEIFVLPGFGVFGLGGAALIVSSLILASQTFILPQNDYQFQQLPRSLVTVAGAGCGVMAGLFVLRRFLDRAPILSRVMLPPPSGEELLERDLRESIVSYGALLGQTGKTTTKLMPAGKASIDGRIVDVISDGEAIAAGTRIRVEEVLGNRIVVTALVDDHSPPTE